MRVLRVRVGEIIRTCSRLGLELRFEVSVRVQTRVDVRVRVRVELILDSFFFLV